MSKTWSELAGLPLGSLINVCDLISCPYGKNNGCNRYDLPAHCHLAYSAPGQAREGVHPTASQCWLYATHDFNLPETQRMQNEFLSQPDEQWRVERTIELERD